MKSTVEQIRERFDRDVERFSNLETGQSATVDAPLTLDLIASVAAAITPSATHLLDIGCGAGNYTLKILQHLPNLNVTLVHLSKPMLDRAVQRVRQATKGEIKTAQSDIRELDLGDSQFDIIVAAAVFHHLREDSEWSSVFRKCHRALRPGGAIWISDLVAHPNREAQSVMWARYGAYSSNCAGRSIENRCSPTSSRRTRRGQCCTRSTCCARLASGKWKSCTRTVASPPSALSKESILGGMVMIPNDYSTTSTQLNKTCSRFYSFGCVYPSIYKGSICQLSR